MACGRRVGGRRIEVGGQSVRLPSIGPVVPAQAVIDGQLARDLPSVLNEESILLFTGPKAGELVQGDCGFVAYQEGREGEAVRSVDGGSDPAARFVGSSSRRRCIARRTGIEGTRIAVAAPLASELVGVVVLDPGGVGQTGRTPFGATRALGEWPQITHATGTGCHCASESLVLPRRNTESSDLEKSVAQDRPCRSGSAVLRMLGQS